MRMARKGDFVVDDLLVAVDVDDVCCSGSGSGFGLGTDRGNTVDPESLRVFLRVGCSSVSSVARREYS